MTFTSPSKGAPRSNGGMKPSATPSMKWQQGDSPANSAASAGSMARMRALG